MQAEKLYAYDICTIQIVFVLIHDKDFRSC